MFTTATTAGTALAIKKYDKDAGRVDIIHARLEENCIRRYCTETNRAGRQCHKYPVNACTVHRERTVHRAIYTVRVQCTGEREQIDK